MNNINININPVAFHLGDWDIRWYPIIILAAILVSILVSLRVCGKYGINKEHILSLVPWLLLSGIIGARLVHVVDRWEIYSRNPLSILALQQGGLAVWGAMAGGVITAIIYARINKIHIGKLLDSVVPGILTAQIIGRVACILNGDAYGDLTTLPWGFTYNHPGAMIPEYLKGISTHPYPVYEMIWNGITLTALLVLRKRFKADGILFITYMIVYSIGRFLLTFTRQEKVWLLGMQEAQLISILVVVAGFIALLIVRRKLFASQLHS